MNIGNNICLKKRSKSIIITKLPVQSHRQHNNKITKNHAIRAAIAVITKKKQQQQHQPIGNQCKE